MKDKKCFIDTNIFLYSFIEHTKKRDEGKKEIADNLLKESVRYTVSTQVIREILANMLKKYDLLTNEQSIELINSFYRRYEVIEINQEILVKAFELRKQNNFGIWDSYLISCALLSGCEIYYTEDLPGINYIDGMEFLNPFRMMF